MTPFSYMRLLELLAPEIIVVITAFAVVSSDLLLLRDRAAQLRFRVAAGLGCTGCAAAILRLLFTPHPVDVFGMFVASPLTYLVQIALLALTIVTLLLSVDSAFTENVGEFVLLVLLATTGMLFLVASQDLLVIFISLELLSLPLYILTGFDKRNPRSSEAALKYFLFGGMSAAFLLFGFSLLYGLSNSTSLPQIAAAIRGASLHPLNPLLVIAMVTTAIGFGFKVAAAPFHFWAPDAYQGAPIPAAAFIASGSKVASFFIFFQMMALGYAGAEGGAGWLRFADGWVPLIAAIAVLSMILGNLVAITQSSVRRLLAYSAIAHTGYMLLAIVAHTQQSLAALLYYVLTYALATLGAFAVVGAVEKHMGSDDFASFDGLSRRSPVLSVCLFVFMLSLAGIPPLAGFFGKFYLFVSVLSATPGSHGLLWLVVLAIAMSAVSLFYYLQVLKRVYVADPDPGPGALCSPLLTQVVVVLLAAAVLVLGCAPHLLLQWIQGAIRASGL